MFSDPINSAPTVYIKCPQDGLVTLSGGACQDGIAGMAGTAPTLVRGDTAFQAVAFDKNQSADSLIYEWWYADKTCSNIFDGPSLAKGGVAPFHYSMEELGSGCVGVVVTDKQGATASAFLLFSVVDQAPTADLKIDSSTVPTVIQPGQTLALPLFTRATLTGKGSTDPDEEDSQLLDFLWSVYDGDTLISMPGCPDPTKEPYRCTVAFDAPGTYRIQLVVADNWKQSDPVEQVIEVAADQLPKIVVETVQPAPPFPPDDAPLQLLASVANTFKVSRVEDDGDPYPSTDPLSPYPTPPAGFVWFYKASADTSFKRLIGETGPSFTLKANAFLPQQSIQVRVEYRDRVTACQPNTPGCNAVFESCNRQATICYAPNLRAQWVTWAVDFR